MFPKCLQLLFKNSGLPASPLQLRTSAATSIQLRPFMLQLEFDELVQEWELCVRSDIQELDPWIHPNNQVELGHVLDNQASSQCDDSELESSHAHLQELDPWIQVDNQLEEAGFDELVEELESCLPCDDDLQGLEKNEPWIQVGDVHSDDDFTHLQQLEPQVQVGHQFGEDQEADSGVLGLTNEELQ